MKEKKVFKLVERQYETYPSYCANGRETCHQDIYKTESAAIEVMHHIVQQFLFINSDYDDNIHPALVLKTERRCVYIIVDYNINMVILLDVYVEEIPVL